MRGRGNERQGRARKWARVLGIWGERVGAARNLGMMVGWGEGPGCLDGVAGVLRGGWFASAGGRERRSGRMGLG